MPNIKTGDFPGTPVEAGAPGDDADRRKRIRRSALIVGLVAIAFYVGFIVMMLLRAAR